MIYHSGANKEIVGLARVVSEPYPDPKHPEGKLTVIDVKADGRLPQPVTLAAIKSDPYFADLPLVRQPRLSVIPVAEPQWKKLLLMGGVK